MTTVREASIRDADGISQVSSCLGYIQSSREESKKRLEAVLASDTDIVWIYEEGTKIKGWIHLFVAIRLASEKFAEIGGLVVDQSYQRSGIGRKLVETAIKWSEQNNLSLRVRCNSEREGANKFYNSLGFKIQKTQIVHEQTSS
jgi:ribosomal protein S18 acetylase RimI-like enzyme